VEKIISARCDLQEEEKKWLKKIRDVKSVWL
jgi:hypothetical protein